MPTRLPSPERLRRALLVLFPLLVVLSAWVQDDAYITFRTVDNLVHGHGAVWNVGERVQAYTHPLWMLLHLPLHALSSGEIYLSTLVLSIGFSLAAFTLLLRRVATSAAAAVAAGTMLVAGRAFVDYSTSGLENPLTHFLLVLYLLVLIEPCTGVDAARRHLFRMALLAALLVLTRPDALLLVLPGLVDAARRAQPRLGGFGVLRATVLGLLPLITWEIFSLIYYGALVPNTALVKLGTGLPRLALIAQGGFYLLYSLLHDPITLVGLGLALVLAWRGEDRPARLAAMGAALYLAYIVWIGGDYMGGRFLSAPLVLAAAAIARTPLDLGALSRRRRIGLTAAFAALLLIPALSTLIPERYEIPGVGNERLRFYHATGLVNGLTRGAFFAGLPIDDHWPDHFFRRKGDYARRHQLDVTVDGFVGFLGYDAGPTVRVVDLIGLPDPFLARLPARRPAATFNRLGAMAWKPGHLPRALPEGYLDSLRTRSNRLEDPNLRRLYDMVGRVTRGPLWSAERWRDILRLHLGRGEELARAYARAHPDDLAPPPDDLRTLFTFDLREVLEESQERSTPRPGAASEPET